MSSYLKISYITPGTNQELMKCIMYIGKYYGNIEMDELLYEEKGNASKAEEIRKRKLRYGIKYLAKKCRTSVTSVKKMIYTTPVRGQKAKQWSFKKRTYSRIYRYILNRMLNPKVGDREEALSLLNDLYVAVNNQSCVEKKISNALVLQQKKMLEWASDKAQYAADWNVIDKILEAYKECDEKYQKEYLGII